MEPHKEEAKARYRAAAPYKKKKKNGNPPCFALYISPPPPSSSLSGLFSRINLLISNLNS
jgi:hypothetical protein